MSAIESNSNDLPPLDYATPARQPISSTVSAVAAAVMGTVAGVFGALMLNFGVTGIIWLVSDWRNVDGGDVFAVVMFNIIGAFSALVAIRWIRSAIKEPGNTAGR